MWELNLPPQNQQPTNSNMHGSCHQLEKRQSFRRQIRTRQIQQIKKQIRIKYYELKDPSDYELLKNINLNTLISECKYSMNQGVIHGMFLYASSQNSDHLFSLTDDKTIDLLVSNMMLKNDCDTYQKEELKWDRKIFWILTNYTSYSQIINEDYVNLLLLISKHLFLQTQQQCSKTTHQYLQQTQQNIVLSVSNLLIRSKNCKYFLKNYPQLLYLLLQRFSNRNPSLIDLVKNNVSVPNLVYYYCEMISNLYTGIQYFQLQEQLQVKTIKYMIKILSIFCDNRASNEQQKRIPIIILNCIKQLLANSIDQHPQIIVLHKKQVKKLSEWFQKFLKSQQQSSKSDQIIIIYLKILSIIYGPNIPEDLQKVISKFYVKFFQNHVGKVCTSMFMNKNPLFYTYTLQLLQPILMQEYLSEMIFTSYLPIVSHIFYHIQNSPFVQKKQALICLINLLKSTLYDNSTTALQVLQILLTNNIADILAINIWSFVDFDLNMELLTGVQILLEADKNQYLARLKFSQRFNEAGGIMKIQRIIQQSSSDDLKNYANNILNQFLPLSEQL